MTYQLKVTLGTVTCHNRESLSEYDAFGLTGAVIVDGQVQAFARDVQAVNERIVGSYPKPVVFDGVTESREVGLVLRGYDVDNTDGWTKHGDDIKEVSSKLADAVSYVPVVGEIAAAVLEHWPKVVDAFTVLDQDDLLLSYATTVILPEVDATGTPRTSHHSILVRSKRDDWSGYSNWNYTIDIHFYYQNMDVPSFGHVLSFSHQPVRLSAPEDWVGIWDGDHVSCMVTASAQGDGLLDVVVQDLRETPHPERVSTGVAISKSWHVDQEVEEVQVSTGRAEPGAVGLTQEGTGLAPGYGSLADVRGSQTVERDIIRRGLSREDVAVQSPDTRGLGRPVKGSVVTDRVRPQREQVGTTDRLHLTGDAVLEIYQVLVDDVAGPGRELRYLSHGSDTSTPSLHYVDEMLSRRVPIT